MHHLTEERLVGLVLERGLGRDHLSVCPDCRARYEALTEAKAFLLESREAPAASAWLQLKQRLVRTRRPDRYWQEPRWLPLVFVHLGVVLIGLILIVAVAGWLESSSLWEWLARLPFLAAVGPRGTVALTFLIGGGLVVLAVTPILFWELRSRSSE